MRSKRRKELACPERGFEPSAPSGRCSEGRIGRNREYCKRQRCKTTIFQPAFVAVSATSRRRGCIGAALVCVNPSVNPPCGVLPAPRKGEPFGSPLTKSCPRWRGKWTRSGRKGNGSEQPSYFTIPPQSATPTAPPRAVELFGTVRRAYTAPKGSHLRGAGNTP